MLKANQIPVFDSTDYVDCIEFKLNKTKYAC